MIRANNSPYLSGSYVPTVTPFRDGRIDEEAFVAHVSWLVAEGSAGIAVGGTSGEPNSLTDSERIQLFELAVSASGGHPVLAGVGKATIDETIYLSHAAERAGAAGLLVITPPFARPSQEGLFRWYDLVCSSTPLPVLAYDNPVRTATSLSADTLARIKEKRENFVGIKLSSSDVDLVTRIRQACGPAFSILAGYEHYTLAMCALGAVGSVSASGNLQPALTARLHTCVEEGKIVEALRIHENLYNANMIVFLGQHPVPLKTALGLLGWMSPEVRPPLAPLNAAEHAGVEDLLAKMDLESVNRPSSLRQAPVAL